MELNNLIEMARLLRAARLSPLRAAILALMRENEEDGYPLRHLAKRMEVSLSGAKVSLRRLEEEGYLELRKERGDHNVKLYTVTEAGVGALIQLELI